MIVGAGSPRSSGSPELCDATMSARNSEGVGTMLSEPSPAGGGT